MNIRIRKGEPKLPPQFLLPLDPCNVPVNRCPLPREEASQRILIMRVGAYGDILMGTALLAALREAYPTAHLTWIAEHTQIQAIDANPYIDEVIRWDGAYWKKMLRRLHYSTWLNRALGFRQELRQRKYNVFISFQPEEWPLLQQGVGAKLTVGVFDTFRRYYRATRTSPYARLYTRAYAYPYLPPHRLDQYLLPLEALNLPPVDNARMTMGFTQEDADAADAFLGQHLAAPNEPFIILAPMTTWVTKCWPGPRYAELGDALAQRHGLRVVLIGSAKEQPAIEQIAKQMQAPAIVVAGTMTFRQIGALIARAQLVVSGDTGPMHMAAALNVPQIALFGPTSVEWYGPRGGRALTIAHEVPCGPCDQKHCLNTGADYMKCIRLISVSEALAAAESILQFSEGAHSCR